MSPHIPIVYEEEKMCWKYKRIDRESDKEGPLTEKELNEFGERGWELCGICTGESFTYYYFKRFSE